MSSDAILSFQRTILSNLTQPGPAALSDGLLIIARGLGLRTIISRFLKIYDEPTNLVLLVNATEDEERSLSEELGMRLRAIGHELPSKERQASYAKGGILSVTSRILVVDMLNKIIPLEHITGLVIMHAETYVVLHLALVIGSESVCNRVTPTATEAFIVRVYREHNNVCDPYS